MVDRELASRIVSLLNELLELDRRAVEALILHRVTCNSALAEHSTVQVSDTGERRSSLLAMGSPRYQVGILGVLNGLCGTFDDGPKTGLGPITAIFDDTSGAQRLERFELTDDTSAAQVMEG